MKTPFFKNRLFIILILLLFVLSLNFFREKVRNFFYLVSEPFQKSFWGMGQGTANFFEAISEIKNLEKENKDLNQKIQELLSEATVLKELKKENESLRQGLNLGLEKEFKLKLAQVRGKDIFQDTLLINKGEKDGVVSGSPVITPQKTLLGRISQIYKDFSKVDLISNPESSFDAKIPDSEIYGIIKGKGNLNLSFELLPKNKEIKITDLVFTTSLAGIFPKGLLVGEVKEIKKTDLESFQTAEVRPAFDIQELENLFIITGF